MFIRPHTVAIVSLIAGCILSAGSIAIAKDYYILRGGLENSRIRFERDKVGRVVFLGGSITQMTGWRDLVGKELQKRFPATKFDFINAGIGSTGSTPGAFRLERDVFSHGPVDLLFEEAAVNDSSNSFPDTAQIRGMEGIVRHARLINPNLDIIHLHFVDPAKMKEIRAGTMPAVIVNHEKVAEHYANPSINLALEVTERIDAGEFTWAQFKNLHPSPFGHGIYLRSIATLFDAAWKSPLPADAKLRPHPLPEQPLDPQSYFNAYLGDVTKTTLAPGWSIDPAWRPGDKCGTRPGFVNVPMLVCETPGKELSYTFDGNVIGLFVAAGNDAGIIEYNIDGIAFKSQDLFTQWSSGLHIPWAFILDADLKPGTHTLKLRLAEGKNPASHGHAVRVVHFLINGPHSSTIH